MATFYSEHYAAETNGLGIVVPRAPIRGYHKVASEKGGSKLYVKFCVLDFTTEDVVAAGDEIRLFSVKSSDGVSKMAFSNTAAWAGTGTFDLSLFAQGENHDGAAVSAAFFASGEDLLATVDDDDFYATDYPTSKGVPIWQQLALSEDPHLTYDIVMEIATGPTTVGGLLHFWMEYIPSSS